MKRPDDLRPLVDAYLNGKTQAALADEYGVSVSSIQNWLVLANSPSPPKGNRKSRWLQKNVDRVSEMSRMYRDGMTLVEIGQHYGITRERVRQLLARVGVTSKEGGASKRGRQNSYARKLRRDQTYLQRYGCTHAEYRKIRGKGDYYSSPLYAYSSQQNNAKFRGIGWEFDLKSWWKVWQDSGKWDQRGRGDGYCMARYGDAGPYSPENVYIAHNVQNLIDCYERMGKDCSKAREKWNLPERGVSA